LLVLVVILIQNIQHDKHPFTFRNKSKKKSKSQPTDPDTLAPPELELMEPGEVTSLHSDAETSMMTEHEPLALQDLMDVSSDTMPGTSSGGFPEGGEDDK